MSQRVSGYLLSIFSLFIFYPFNNQMLIKRLLSISPLLRPGDTRKNKIQAPTLKKLTVSLVETTET